MEEEEAAELTEVQIQMPTDNDKAEDAGKGDSPADDNPGGGETRVRKW